MDWEGKTVLVTGGTGSFGKKFIEILLSRFKLKKLIVFSRDELKQFEMRKKFNSPVMRYFIGDVRDENRLIRAFEGVDIVIHAAALKQVPSCEYNPIEAIRTNVLGAENVVNAALNCGVKKVIALSTDKAVNPINLYGATKLSAEKLFVASNSYAGNKPTRFSIVRYGNVIGSRGSVVPFFVEKKKDGVIPVTNDQMTRFWITLEVAVELVIRVADVMKGGEIFIPKIPSMKIIDLAKTICPECKTEIIGVRPGEKIHEVLITEHEARRTLDFKDYFVILPEFNEWDGGQVEGGTKVPEGFHYSSDNNDKWITNDEMLDLVKKLN